MIGKTIIELKRIDSTNNYADMMLQRGGLEEGTVIMAMEQFAGRGQNENSWVSEPGKNLTISVILHPHFLSAGRQFLLNKTISLGIADYLKSLFSRISVKWPNDICYGNRKLAGILIENKIEGSVINTSIVGIGINVNQTFFPGVVPDPVSMIEVLQRETIINDVLAMLCRFLDHRYLQLANGDNDRLDEDYKHSLLGYQEWKFYERSGNRFEGKIEGVDEFGRLKILTRDGKHSAFDHKEIGFLRS